MVAPDPNGKHEAENYEDYLNEKKIKYYNKAYLLIDHIEQSSLKQKDKDVLMGEITNMIVFRKATLIGEVK
jgi:hypothetical protein